MAHELRYVAVSDVGRVRTVNQDSGYASERLLIVADGMGGAAAGDLASSEVMHVMTRLDKPLEGDGLEALAGAVHRANDRLAEIIEDDSTVEGMGTTLTALLFDADGIAMAHIGDSRAYRLRDGLLTQLTDDHTFVQSLVDEGRISEDEARTHPHRSVILRVLLGRDDCDPDLTRLEPRVGDRYLICSDGLSGMVDDPKIGEILASSTIELAAVDLVRLALDAGGTDNITCVIGEVVDPESPVDQPPSATGTQAMLVGAASEQPRARATHTSTMGAVGTDAKGERDGHPAGGGTPVDPEEIRYAPQAPRRFRWLKRIIGLAVVLAILALIGKLAYDWSQDQYYVADSDGYVAIYRGVPQEMPGLDLSDVQETTDIKVDSLPPYSQEQVRDAVDANSYEAAQNVVDNLRDQAERCADPDATDEECEGSGSDETTTSKNTDKSGDGKGDNKNKDGDNKNGRNKSPRKGGGGRQ
ncbi:PP2C family protein-serine/threonine phosphatase [Solicola gregarius]|uniref:Protein phosphatase 2C domain-containing protein n=1 Tax=Solicola gregarius TaxID=2908642 RepID=A0AA46TLN9_9ACTN|nr:protein phosphatase 2C domain-containing protein [Solicola gregarius]UYM07413.1 protein phosphatase 2C domain-containing protein [Solicola gregarius]